MSANTIDLLHEIDAAWLDVEAAEPIEAEARRVLAEKQAAAEKVPQLYDAEHLELIAGADEARSALAEARDAVGLALRRVDLAEAQLLALGAGLPADMDRGRPRRAVSATVVFAAEDAGALAPYLAEVERLGGTSHRALLTGTVPPRWLAHRLDDACFDDLDSSRRDLMQSGVDMLDQIDAERYDRAAS